MKRLKADDLKVGGVYANRNKGTTHRKILEISSDLQPPWYANEDQPKEDVVQYETVKGQRLGQTNVLYISSFLAWCGEEVKANE